MAVLNDALLLLSCITCGFASLTITHTHNDSLESMVLQLQQNMVTLQAQTQLQEEKNAAVLKDVLLQLNSMKTVKVSTSGDDGFDSVGNVDVVSLNSHVLQLEQTVADLQSQTQTQEQKYSAVLSSVLSKLTNTTGELANVKSELKQVKNDYKSLQGQVTTLEDSLRRKEEELSGELLSIKDNLTVFETHVSDTQFHLNKSEEQLESIMSELASVKSDLLISVTMVNLTTVTSDLQTTTDNLTSVKSEVAEIKSDISELKLAHNEITNLKSEMNSTQIDLNLYITRLRNDGLAVAALSKKFDLPPVAFRVVQLGRQTSGISGRAISFRPVKYNSGNAYQADKGIFIAPVAGVYLFWFSPVFGSTSLNVTVNIKTPAETIGSAYKEIGQHDTPDTVTAITVAYVSMGGRVSFTTTASHGSVICYKELSSYGGVLLRRI